MRPDSEPLSLPPAAAPVVRPPLPLAAAVVPVLGAVVLWLVTGSAFALWFAALGPLMAVAGILDAARGGRRSRRRSRAERARAVERLGAEVARRHAGERSAAWARHPDVRGFLAVPADIWRAVPERAGCLTVGAGDTESAVRIAAQAGEEDTDAATLRAAAVRLQDAPVVVPSTAGVAVIGPTVLARAVARGLLLQLCLAEPPGRLTLVDPTPGWAEALPHREGPGELRAQLVEPGGVIGADVDVPIVVVPAGSPAPPRCAALLSLTAPDAAVLEHGTRALPVRVEPVADADAAQVAEQLRVRAARVHGRGSETAADLRVLLEGHRDDGDGLTVAFATTAGEPFPLDLVADGPHAVVVGVTGSGKSELLTSWVVGMCAAYDATRVSFLLVDFKGGRTFDHLLPLPHVAGVLTDLDAAAAVRAIESLRAEIRHRERLLGEAGARDVTEAATLGRLVIVVDEYAALVAEHPALHDLFADVAARGRALGMHLVLATQRAAGSIREAVLANAPLRIALRVTDPADSRAVLGVADAAALSGRPEARGTALVRRAADGAPVLVRVARCTAATLAGVAAASFGDRARRPWLPALPAQLPWSALPPVAADAVVLGLGDEPQQQRQPAVAWEPAHACLAVLGRAGSGRSTVLAAIGAQTAAAWMPAAPEAAWDFLAGLEELPAGTTLLLDDLDALLSRLPAVYAAEAAERCEAALREARARGIRIALSAIRPTGAVGRLIDLVPHRLLLAQASRADHVAAGGDAGDHVPDAPPGRARLGRLPLQVVAADLPLPPDAVASPPWWRPGRRPAAVVLPAGARQRALVAAWQAGGVTAMEVTAGGEPGPGQLVWGTPDGWLAAWRSLSHARAAADLVVDAACAAEFRSLTGRSGLPPYALPGAGRAWLCRPDRPARRVVLDPT